MINKFILHTRDNVLELDIEKATIFTGTYSRKIKLGEVHTPVAAKIIIEHDHVITMFILPNPIVKSEKTGIVSAWTAAPFEKVSSKVSFIDSEEELKQLVNLEKLLRSKEKIGLTLNEIFELERVSTLLTVAELLRKKANINIGGGF